LVLRRMSQWGVLAQLPIQIEAKQQQQHQQQQATASGSRLQVAANRQDQG